jgi:hypothetical protein
MRSALILIGILLLCSARSIRTDPLWELAASGKNSGVFERKTVICHNKKSLLKAWAELRKASPDLQANPPSVDFKKQLLIACYAGD